MDEGRKEGRKRKEDGRQKEEGRNQGTKEPRMKSMKIGRKDKRKEAAREGERSRSPHAR